MFGFSTSFPGSPRPSTPHSTRMVTPVLKSCTPMPDRRGQQCVHPFHGRSICKRLGIFRRRFKQGGARLRPVTKLLPTQSDVVPDPSAMPRPGVPCSLLSYGPKTHAATGLWSLASAPRGERNTSHTSLRVQVVGTNRPSQWYALVASPLHRNVCSSAVFG